MNRKSERLPRQFGDYQTPPGLARQCCQVIRDQLGEHATLVEPTCGRGSFLVAAAEVFQADRIVAMEQNESYVRAARRVINLSAVDSRHQKVEVRKQNFFHFDWATFRQSCGERVLFFGNPPWVTLSEIGVHSGDNLPEKTQREFRSRDRRHHWQVELRSWRVHSADATWGDATGC